MTKATSAASATLAASAEQAHRPAPPVAADRVATAALAPAAAPAALSDIGTLPQRITALPPLPETMTAVLLALNRAPL